MDTIIATLYTPSGHMFAGILALLLVLCWLLACAVYLDVCKQEKRVIAVETAYSAVNDMLLAQVQLGKLAQREIASLRGQGAVMTMRPAVI